MLSSRRPHISCSSLLLSTVLVAFLARSGMANDDGGKNYQGNDDGMQSYSNYNYQKSSQGSDGSITYWTDYAILPKRCIVYNNVDVIVFSMFENQYKHCADEPIGTYIASAPDFLQAYLKEYAQVMEDRGQEYEEPEVAKYTSCTPYMIQDKYYYFQVGCADGTSQKLAVNIYEDNTCTQRSTVDGYDDSTIDISSIELPFKKCQSCVNWVNKNDDEIDDAFYENRQTQAPLCSEAWAIKQECGRKCQHTGVEANGNGGWNTSDKVLLAVLTAFGVAMLALIVRKRQKMSNKDALLEQAAMSAAGLQQPHVIGIFILVVIVIAVFALLGLKDITWALLLIINTALFGYLMKLTVDSGVSAGETVIGPDGTIMRRDSDDSSMESSRESTRHTPTAGSYVLPTLA